MNTRTPVLLSLAGALLTAQTPSINVTFDRLLAANKEPQNWLTYSGTAMSQRYSLLTQITTANVKNLEQAWTLKTQTGEKFEQTPLVVGGVMYTVVPPPPRGGRGGGRGRGRGAAAANAEAGLAAPTPAPAPPPAPVAPQTFDVIALNATTGATLWTYRTFPPTTRSPAAAA